MKKLLSWIFSALIFAAVGGLCVYSFMTAGHNEESEAEKKSPLESVGPDHETQAVTHDEKGDILLLVDRQTQMRVGVTVEPLAAATHRPEYIAYGVLQEDPAQTFTLRSPFPGILITAPATRWPNIGDRLNDQVTIGGVEPRLGPIEMADVASRLATARADVAEAEASLAASRASYESKQKLNAEQKIVSDEVLREADAKVKGDEARLQAAKETVHILESFKTTATRPADTMPLTIPSSGKVVEVFVQPGEAVESGQPLLRVACFDQLLARVSLPVGQPENVDKSANETRVVVAGYEARPLQAKRIASAVMVDPALGGPTFFFAINAQDLPLQPGMAVTASLPQPGETLNGVTVPRSAVIRLAGKAWVYVQVQPEQFARRGVTLGRPTPQGWFETENLKPGDPVVVRGVQSLLSAELKFQTEEEEE